MTVPRRQPPVPDPNPTDLASGPPEHAAIARLIEQARGLWEQRALADSEAPLRQALALAEALPDDDPDRLWLAVVESHLGWLAAVRQQHDHAVRSYRRALALREAVLGPDHADTLRAVEELATALFDAEARDEEADALAVRALEAYDEAGRDDPEFASWIATVGWRRYWIGRYVDAEPLLCRALDMRRRLLGSDHADTADTAKRLAIMYDHRGFDDDPEPLYREALEGCEAAHGLSHPDTIEARYRLADYLDRQGRDDDAAPLFDQLADDFTAPRPPVEPDRVHWMLGACCDYLRQNGRADEAEAIETWAASYDPLIFMQRAEAERAETAFGPDSLELADALDSLANDYVVGGRADEAEATLRRVLTIRQTRLGPDDPATRSVVDRLANVHAASAPWAEQRATPRRLRRFRNKLFDSFSFPWRDERRPDLIEAYLAHAAGTVEPDDDGDDDPTGAGEALVGLVGVDDPDETWEFLLELIAAAPDDDDRVLGMIAAGPLEGFLGKFDGAVIERVEAEAARDPKFRRVLSGVWRHGMSEPVWARVRTLQAAEPQPLPEMRPFSDEVPS